MMYEIYIPMSEIQNYACNFTRNKFFFIFVQKKFHFYSLVIIYIFISVGTK